MTEVAQVDCCGLGTSHIHWAEADDICGPGVDGWVVYMYIGGFVYKPNINFCPFCGQKLYEEDERMCPGSTEDNKHMFSSGIGGHCQICGHGHK